MISRLKQFINDLKSYSKPIMPNFRPDISAPRNGIVPVSYFEHSKKWKGIVLHGSATVDGKLNDWEGIRKYHTSYRIDGNIVTEEVFNQRILIGSGKKFEKPWSQIGYHAGQEIDGMAVEFKLGRAWNIAGAHAGIHVNGHSVNTYNEDYLGYCIVGNWDKTAPTKDVWTYALRAIREIITALNIDKSRVIGHREIYVEAGIPVEKTCPGKLFDLNQFRSEL